jgi:hypothetical protein
MGMWRIFYEQDIKQRRKSILRVCSQIWSVYRGPVEKVNVYERTGRIVLGTVLLIFWLGACAIWLFTIAAIALGFWMLLGWAFVLRSPF